MTKRQAQMDKIMDSTWSIGCHVLTFVICAIFIGLGLKVLQSLPPMPEHPTHFVGEDYSP